MSRHLRRYFGGAFRAARTRGGDIERLFGVGKVRAAALMKTFGAELVGNQRTLPRTKLLQHLPDGVSIERGRIEVRFDGAEDALARLYTLAQALGNDLRRFQSLVGR